MLGFRRGWFKGIIKVIFFFFEFSVFRGCFFYVVVDDGF